MIDVYRLPGYSELAGLMLREEPTAQRRAMTLMRIQNGSMLTEQEMRKALYKIKISEGVIRDLVTYLYNTVTGAITSAVSFFTGRGPSSLIKQIERELPQLRSKADEVKRNMEVPDFGTPEADEIMRRMKEKIPLPPQELINKYALKENEQVMSFTRFFQKWIMLYVVFSIARWLVGITGVLTGGIGFAGFTLIHLPFLLVMIDDLMYQVGRSEYVTP